LTAWTKNAMHFDQSTDRIAEVFECGAANHEIEAIAREWQCRGIALPELNRNARLLCIDRRHADERSADVETSDLIAANPGQLDCQIAGARRDFEHPRAPRQALGNPLGASAEVRGQFCGISGVPGGQYSF